MIHKLNDEQMELVKQFLACFMKPEVINIANNGKKLTELQVKGDKICFPCGTCAYA